MWARRRARSSGPTRCPYRCRPAPDETLTESVVPQMIARGWRATNRDTDREFGVHFGRDGFDVGVLIGRSDGADVVVGGSTPEFATVP